MYLKSDSTTVTLRMRKTKLQREEGGYLLKVTQRQRQSWTAKAGTQVSVSDILYLHHPICRLQKRNTPIVGLKSLYFLPEKDVKIRTKAS